jgi:hypothetical protein
VVSNQAQKGAPHRLVPFSAYEVSWRVRVEGYPSRLARCTPVVGSSALSSGEERLGRQLFYSQYEYTIRTNFCQAIFSQQTRSWIFAYNVIYSNHRVAASFAY